MFILRRKFGGKTTEMPIDMDIDEFTAAEQNWKNGALIQNAFPTLDCDAREFIMTGITPEHWDEMFKNE